MQPLPHMLQLAELGTEIASVSTVSRQNNSEALRLLICPTFPLRCMECSEENWSLCSLGGAKPGASPQVNLDLATP